MTSPSPIIDILIPARDEEAALPHLLAEIDRELIQKIIVVDNGSRDRTAEVAAQSGCHVVYEPQPGYGRACLAGINYLKNNQPPDILIFLDGDRSDHPKFIPDLVAPIRDQGCHLVIGSRALGVAEAGSLTFTQRFGNRLATFLIRIFWGLGFTDLGPFRAITWHALTAMNMQDKTFGWTVEMQIKAAMLGLKSTEVPVDYRNRIGTSKISGTVSGVLKAGYKILFTVFKYKFWPPAKRTVTQSNAKERP